MYAENCLYPLFFGRMRGNRKSIALSSLLTVISNLCLYLLSLVHCSREEEEEEEEREKEREEEDRERERERRIRKRDGEREEEEREDAQAMRANSKPGRKILICDEIRFWACVRVCVCVCVHCF